MEGKVKKENGMGNPDDVERTMTSLAHHSMEIMRTLNALITSTSRRGPIPPDVKRLYDQMESVHEDIQQTASNNGGEYKG